MAATPLWSETNGTMWSDAFSVPPGYCVVLFASGLAEEKVRKSAEEFKGPQMACVERLILKGVPQDPMKPCDGQCGPRAAQSDPSAKVELSDYVETCSLPWTLEPCRNLGIIGIPGTYRIRLNDATAAGTAQVWAEWYPHDAVAPQAYGAFFS